MQYLGDLGLAELAPRAEALHQRATEGGAGGAGLVVVAFAGGGSEGVEEGGLCFGWVWFGLVWFGFVERFFC